MQAVAEQTGWNRRAISPETRIEADLGCTGDEARELLLRFEREFGVDMSGVDFAKHFHNETSSGWPIAVALVVALPIAFLSMHALGAAARAGGWTLPAAVQGSGGFVLVYLASALLIGGLTKLVPRRSRKSQVTVQHLIDAVRLGSWPLDSSESRK